MQRRELEAALRRLGWYPLREGGNHTLWTNGTMSRPIPRHREINEHTARGILRFAAANPGAAEAEDTED